MFQKMTSYRFKSPGLIPWLFLCGSLALLLTLGTWQMQRLAWKEKLIADIQAAQAAPIVTKLPDDPVELSKLAYRNVRLTGQYSEYHTVFRPTALEGRGPAYHILQPFIAKKNVPILLADRIVVPASDPYYLDLIRPDFVPHYTVHEVEGILRPAYTARFFTPANQPEKKLWFSEDIPALSYTLEVPLASMVLHVTSTHLPGEEAVDNPKLRQQLLTMRNDHLGYAITWFALAIIAIVMFGVYFSERRPADE